MSTHPLPLLPSAGCCIPRILDAILQPSPPCFSSPLLGYIFHFKILNQLREAFFPLSSFHLGQLLIGSRNKLKISLGGNEGHYS